MKIIMVRHKKIIAIVLLLAMTFSLTACGGGKTTKDNLLSVAEEVDISILMKEAKENIARAEQNYVGKAVVLSGYVSHINSDNCMLKERSRNDILVQVYLPKEELAELEKGIHISIVGEITDISNTYITVENAYLNETVFESSGILTVKTTWMEYYDASGRLQHTGSLSEWTHYFTDDKGNAFKLLAADVEIKNGELVILGQTYKNGDTMTVTGTQFYEQVSSNKHQYYMFVDSIELNE